MAQVLRIHVMFICKDTPASWENSGLKLKLHLLKSQQMFSLSFRILKKKKEIKEMFPYTSQVIYPSFEEAEVKLLEKKKSQSRWKQ